MKFSKSSRRKSAAFLCVLSIGRWLLAPGSWVLAVEIRELRAQTKHGKDKNALV